MLVPATAEDLRTGGKIVMQKEEEDSCSQVPLYLDNMNIVICSLKLSTPYSLTFFYHFLFVLFVLW